MLEFFKVNERHHNTGLLREHFLSIKELEKVAEEKGNIGCHKNGKVLYIKNTLN